MIMAIATVEDIYKVFAKIITNRNGFIVFLKTKAVKPIMQCKNQLAIYIWTLKKIDPKLIEARV
jgi:hypothetical protein